LKRDLKKQIKRDELVTGFEQARHAAAAHMDELKIVGLVVVVLAVGGFALQHFRSQRDRDAQEALGGALQTFRAPVASEVTPGEEAPPAQFATAAEKYQKALTDFENVVRRYGTHPTAVRARYYAALCKIELGQNVDAEKELQDLAGRHDNDRLEPALARLALADLQRRVGQVDRAIDAYKQIADDAAFPLPREQALMTLARLYEDSHRADDARAAYQQVIERFPESPAAAAARQRVEFLQARG
jgi:TolA-binding protein